MRIACLVLSQFNVDVCLRAKPSLRGRPIAVAEGASRCTIACASGDALGVSAGMTPKQARAACPGLVIVARDEVAEREATGELLDALETCSPIVAGALPGMCYFDAGNLPAGESAALGSALAIAAALGFSEAAAAIADDKFTARCAAVAAKEGASVVPPGKSPAFLAPLPVTLLPLAPGDFDRFELLGLRTLGHIAALPEGPLAARFGERARVYARFARGEDDEPLLPRRAQTMHEQRFAFDGSIDRLEALLFALRGCVSTVADRLAGCAQACDRVEIALEPSRAPAGASGCISIAVALAEPTACAETIFQLCRIALESKNTLGPVDAIAVRAGPCSEPLPQLALFDGSRASRRAALAATLARLQVSLERERVVTLQPTPKRSRLPERMQRAIPIESPRELDDDATRASARARQRPTVEPLQWAPALRLLDPPSRIDPPAAPALEAGPFRLSESWWERPVERDYYHVVDTAGAVLLVYQDRRDDCWYVQGVFD